jgi:MoaA/NifB/PqqE/SkfB family radical SAM enzyme
MTTTVTTYRSPDLWIRFFGDDAALLSRRDGRRHAVDGLAARTLRRLVGSLGPSGLERLARDGAGFAEGERLAHALGRQFDALDEAPAPTPRWTVLGRAPALYAHARRERVPLFAMCECTYRCNLRCTHCFILHKVSARRPDLVSTEHVLRLLDELVELGCLEVTLTGGETTLHPDYRALVSAARSLHLITTLKTNATTFTRERACEYAADPAHATEASLYGSTPEVHDAFTATPGSFAKTMRGLAELARAGVRCTISSIIWERNTAQADDIARLVEDLGHQVVFDDVIYGRLDGDRAPIALRASRDARDRLVAQGRLKPFEPSPCVAGQVKVKIAADGAIASCELFPAGFGNVWSQGFDAPWRDPRFVGEADRMVQLSTAHHRDGRPVLICPAMNQLNTGRMEGETAV